MDPLPLFGHRAFTPAIRELIVEKLTDQAAVQLSQTCTDAQELVTSIRGEALEVHEQTVQKYKQLLKKAPWLRGISADRARFLLARMNYLVVGITTRMFHPGMMRKKERETIKAAGILADAVPLLEKLLEKDDFVQ